MAVTNNGGGRRWLPLVIVAVAVGAGGCSQTTPQPVTEAALTAPLVLNSAPGATPDPAATTAPAPVASAPEDDGQFPNINKPPTQPGGTLLPAEARAQIISELEALRAKQPTDGGNAKAAGKPSDLANQASTHGQDAIDQIEACSEDGALQSNPDCAPVD